MYAVGFIVMHSSEACFCEQGLEWNTRGIGLNGEHFKLHIAHNTECHGKMSASSGPPVVRVC